MFSLLSIERFACSYFWLVSNKIIIIMKMCMFSRAYWCAIKRKLTFHTGSTIGLRHSWSAVELTNPPSNFRSIFPFLCIECKQKKNSSKIYCEDKIDFSAFYPRNICSIIQTVYKFQNCGVREQCVSSESNLCDKFMLKKRNSLA